jgi:hypothetical protein
MSRPVQMANDHWDPISGSTGGGFAAPTRHPTHGAAARLWRAIVRWQIRRLERRLASLEVDEHSLH